jgi:tetratricopeptide (TPR) repeat protein
MSQQGNRISFLVGLGLIVIYFAVLLPTLPLWFSSVFITAIYWVVVAVFIAPPIASFLGEKFIAPFIGERGAKITRDYSRARSLAAQGRFEEAIEEFRTGLEEDPENVMLRLEIAEIYSAEMKDFRQAISELEACFNLPLGETQGASILNRIADIYETNLDDAEAAIATLIRITEKWPSTKLAWRAQQRIEAILQDKQGRA